MSNSNIIDRLSALADAVELGDLSIGEMRDTLLGHIEAVEGIPYSMITEAHFVWAQLSRAIEAGEERTVNPHILGDWLRNWSDRVPTPRE